MSTKKGLGRGLGALLGDTALQMEENEMCIRDRRRTFRSVQRGADRRGDLPISGTLLGAAPGLSCL